LNFEYFIAKRIIGSKTYKSSVSAPIIKIGIAAIAIGMIVMMIAIATGIGLQQKIRDKAVAFNGHITIQEFNSNLSDESQVSISTEQDFYPQFNSVEGIRHIQGVATKFGLIRTETYFEGPIFKGVGADFDWSYFQEFLVAGKLPSYGDRTSNDVIISEYLANRLEFKLGDSFQMLFAKEDPNRPPFIRQFNIVGIFNSGFQELDETYLIGDINHIRFFNKWKDNEVGNFEIFLEDYSELREKEEQIYQNISSFFTSKTVEDRYASVFEWIAVFDKNIYGIIGIMIIVAGINMITALLVLILERTQMIGVLKALGSNNWSIRKLFLYNASYLVVLGLFWGNLIGLTILLSQKYFKLFPLDPSVYHVTEAPVYINLGYIISLNVGTFLLCMVMLLVPSYVITKISPVKAIRFE
jgi:lipoprotein-releasing system permease protein